MTDELVCSGSVHIPGCAHFTTLEERMVDVGYTPEEIAATLEAQLPDVDEILAGSVTSVTAVTPDLSVTLVVTVGRVGRKRCPICGLLRVLIRLTAFAADQPVGYGQAKCAQCAGLRQVR